MNNYETEEQQVEAIKEWWQQNFKTVIFVVIIGLTSIAVVQQWKQNKIVNAQTASVEYDHILQVVQNNKKETINQQVETMLNDYSDYPYASLAALLEAKQLVDANKLVESETKFQWVIDHSKAQNLQHIARLRLAAVLLEQAKNEQALQLLKAESGQFNARYLELKGDILVVMKKIKEARSAYDQALEAYAIIGSNAQILKIKRNDLGNS
jgi:predicted negative regulator of RcsB-dependent stress response